MQTRTKWNELVKIYPRDNAPMQIDLAGISHCDAHYRIERPQSQITVIEYVLDGEGTVVVDGVPHRVTKDHIYLLPKGQRHCYYASAEAPWVKIFMNAVGDLPVWLMREYGLERQWLFDGHGMRDVFEQVAAIVRRETTDPGEDARLVALFHEALFRLHKNVAQAVHPPEAVRMKDYLDSRPHQLVSNNELAAAVFRSPDYCVKLFRREFGTTPYDYQIRNKMQVATKLLRNTRLPVAQIAAHVGYHDPCYFSNLFRRKQGVSPRQYRQRAALPAENASLNNNNPYK